MAHPCGMEVLTLSGELAVCLPNCIHRCWSDQVHCKCRIHSGCMPACDRSPTASSGMTWSKHLAWSKDMRMPPWSNAACNGKIAVAASRPGIAPWVQLGTKCCSHACVSWRFAKALEMIRHTTGCMAMGLISSTRTWPKGPSAFGSMTCLLCLQTSGNWFAAIQRSHRSSKMRQAAIGQWQTSAADQPSGPQLSVVFLRAACSNSSGVSCQDPGIGAPGRRESCWDLRRCNSSGKASLFQMRFQKVLMASKASLGLLVAARSSPGPVASASKAGGRTKTCCLSHCVTYLSFCKILRLHLLIVWARRRPFSVARSFCAVASALSHDTSCGICSGHVRFRATRSFWSTRGCCLIASVRRPTNLAKDLCLKVLSACLNLTCDPTFMSCGCEPLGL